VDFLLRGDPPCLNQCSPKSEPSPYNHHLQQFLTFLKQERGFADATIVNRKRSLKPFLAWLVAQGVPLSGVSPVVITKYFTGAVAGKWKRTSVSFHVQSVRSFFRYASCRAALLRVLAHFRCKPTVLQGPVVSCGRFCTNLCATPKYIDVLASGRVNSMAPVSKG
jgi:hypothetical protein